MDFAVSIGISEVSAPFVPFLFIMLILFIFIKVVSPNKLNNKISSKTATKKPLPGKVLDKSGSSLEGRIVSRHFDRTEMNIKALQKITFTTEENDTQRTCKILDLSLSGLKCQVNEYMEKGTKMRFKFPNMDDKLNLETFNVSGQIVRCDANKDKSFNYGIKFFHVFSRDLELLKILINKKKK